jgi:hypothetical protein
MNRERISTAPSPEAPAADRDRTTLLFWAGAAAVIVLLLFQDIIVLRAYTLFDDAHMFIHYADNLIATGRVSWNYHGDPTYGLTALLYLAVIVPLRLLLPDDPIAVAFLGSWLSGAAFLLALLALMYRVFQGRTVIGKVAILTVMVCLLNAHAEFQIHFASGMDTAFDLLYLTLYLFVSEWRTRSGALRAALAAGLLGGLAFWVRPDLCLFTFLVPAAGLVLGQGPARRHAALTLGLTAVLTGGLLLFSNWYFQTPLPLSFFCKSLSTYGEAMRDRYDRAPLEQLALFFDHYKPLLIVAGLGLGLSLKSWRRPEMATVVGLFAATVLFIVYYGFFVMQIMYYGSRFYYPTLPAIVYLALFGFGRIQQEVLSRQPEAGTVLRPAAGIVMALLLVSMIFPVLEIGASLREVNSAEFSPEDQTGGGWQATMARHRQDLDKGWFQVQAVSALPDDLVLATTEVGWVASCNPRKTIVDMTGLNTPDFALHPFDPELMFKKYNPDFIYMPHFHYVKMTKLIENSPTFQARYYYVKRELIHTSFGVAYRKDSKYAPQLAEIVTSGMMPPKGP